MELNSLGILRQTKLPSTLDWLTDADKTLLLDLLLAGEDGISKALIAKWDKAHPESSLRLSTNSLADWITDKRGKPAFLGLTWKGEEAAKMVKEVAMHATRPRRTVPSQLSAS